MLSALFFVPAYIVRLLKVYMTLGISNGTPLSPAAGPISKVPLALEPTTSQRTWEAIGIAPSQWPLQRSCRKIFPARQSTPWLSTMRIAFLLESFAVRFEHRDMS